MKRSFVLTLGLAACASGGERPLDGDPGQDGNPTIDARPIDAPPPDAPPQMVTLSQNVSPTASGNSIACSQTNFTRENSYYRVFSLAEHGVPGMFRVQQVSFVVQTATAGGGAATQAGQIKIGRYTGAAGSASLDVAQVVPVNAAAIAIPNGAGTVNVPITGTFPGGNIIVELAIPDGFAAQNTFYIGTNAAGETKPGYLRAPACGLAAPSGMNAFGMAQSPPLPKADLIMTVTGLKF